MTFGKMVAGDIAAAFQIVGLGVVLEGVHLLVRRLHASQLAARVR